jgi:hippurate hydrolase
VRSEDLLADAHALLPTLLPIRRELHERPEMGLQLPATQAIVVRELKELGIEPRLGTSVTSATALFDGGEPGPTVLLRADMDALPLQEDTGLAFASRVDGVMHACGHDTHITMLLGACRLLLARRELLHGQVLLMFQPGEEGFHGARSMIEEGLLETAGSPPIEAFALHISTRYPSGTINVRSGSMMASSDTLRITVHGRGGHASTPHLALDPITVGAEIVLGLQAMVSRRVDVFDPAVVTIARLTAGTTTNIIPEIARLEGTIRTVSETTRSQVLGYIEELVTGIAQAYGASAEVSIEPGYPVTINHAEPVERILELAAGLVGDGAVERLAAPLMGAEDFSYVLQRVPGAMAFLGARPADQDPLTAPQNHSNRVVFDEDAMAVGIALYAAVALDILTPN